jgi:glycosyltransferase involved in cell wall biosynthesis
MNVAADKPRLKILLVSNHRRFKINFRAHPWARELAALGHDVDVFCHADTERWRTRIEQCDGFRIVEHPDMLVGPLRQGWDPYCAWRRKRFLFAEDKDYDIIHCLDTRLAVIWPCLAYARARGIPIVSDWIDWWGRGGLIDERRPWWYKKTFGGVETWFEEHYRDQLDGLTAISHALIDRAVALGVPRDHTFWIPGGANLQAFANSPSKEESRRMQDIGAEAPVVCFSGLDVLIDLPLAVVAFQQVRAAKPDAVLLLVGPTQRQAREAAGGGEIDGIVATGPIPYRDLAAHLAAADVYLMPYANKVSNVGRWPNKVGDYFCMARPIVSNPVGEVKLLFEDHEVGVLAEETPESMAHAVMRLLDDPGRCAELGRNGLEVAETLLPWTRLVAGLEAWYRDVLRRVG